MTIIEPDPSCVDNQITAIWRLDLADGSEACRLRWIREGKWLPRTDATDSAYPYRLQLLTAKPLSNIGAVFRPHQIQVLEARLRSHLLPVQLLQTHVPAEGVALDHSVVSVPQSSHRKGPFRLGNCVGDFVSSKRLPSDGRSFPGFTEPLSPMFIEVLPQRGSSSLRLCLQVLRASSSSGKRISPVLGLIKA
jgi:hypothetical protein